MTACETDLAGTPDVSEILEHDLLWIRRDARLRRVRGICARERGRNRAPKVCLSARFGHLERQAADDERNAGLRVVQRVAVAEKALVEEALAVIGRDDHRRRPAARAGHDVDRGTDRTIYVRRRVVVHVAQLVCSRGSDSRLLEYATGNDRLDVLVMV